MHWVMLKQSKGQSVGYLKELWYHFAKNMSLVALSMYGIDVDKSQYSEAMETLTSCSLENLDFMNKITEAKKMMTYIILAAGKGSN